MMAAAKAFLVAFGAVSVGASECSNTTLHVAKSSGDVAVDSDHVWFTVNLEDGGVWVCSKDEKYPCHRMGGAGWGWPQGIAVDDSGDFPVVFVAVQRDPHGKPTVATCTWNDHVPFACFDFGSGWTSPRGVALDTEGNVFITDAYGDSRGVWKCARHAFPVACTLVGDSNHWPGTRSPNGVAVDSQGNVYVANGYQAANGYTAPNNFIIKCTSTGNCTNFGGDLPRSNGHDTAIAIGPDDNLYISDSGTNILTRCTPDNVCENVGAFNGVDNMVIDENGVLYAADGGLRRICLSPSIKDIQV